VPEMFLFKKYFPNCFKTEFRRRLYLLIPWCR